jgi:pimeloyl-ACP methyl ester carboxylesterase
MSRDCWSTSPLATPGHPVVDEDTFAAVEALLAADQRETALTLFFRRVIGLPDAAIDAMRGTPIWAARLAAAHTMPREGRAMDEFHLDPAVLSTVPYPVLVMAGSESPAFLRTAAEATHAAMPDSEYVVLENQAHMAMDTAPELFVGLVLRFARAAHAVSKT